MYYILALLLVVCYVGPWLLCGAMRHLARWCVTCASARLVLVPVLGCPGSRSEQLARARHASSLLTNTHPRQVIVDIIGVSCFYEGCKLSTQMSQFKQHER